MSRQNRERTGNGRKRLAAAVLAAVIALVPAVPALADEGAQQEKGPGITTAAETEAQPAEVTEEQVNAFYRDAVFVGDSIMEDFQLYCRCRKSDPFLQQFRFLARTSFSLHNAFMPISKKTAAICAQFSYARNSVFTVSITVDVYLAGKVPNTQKQVLIT